MRVATYYVPTLAGHRVGNYKFRRLVRSLIWRWSHEKLTSNSSLIHFRRRLPLWWMMIQGPWTTKLPYDRLPIIMKLSSCFQGELEDHDERMWRESGAFKTLLYYLYMAGTHRSFHAKSYFQSPCKLFPHQRKYVLHAWLNVQALSSECLRALTYQPYGFYTTNVRH